MVSYRHWSVLLWWDPNDVPHRRILPSYEAERWSVPASLCWWCCYCLADQLWVLIAYARRRRMGTKDASVCGCMTVAPSDCCFYGTGQKYPYLLNANTNANTNANNDITRCKINNSISQILGNCTRNVLQVIMQHNLHLEISKNQDRKSRVQGL